MQENETTRQHGEGEFKRKLSRALLHFQDRLLEANITPGSLCQVWMPEMSEEGEQVLKAKGQPYCAAGVVDLLALFRCISCRYCFSTDTSKPQLLGAPGRVFTSRQPEMTRNVQQQSKDVYLRAQEALHCRVHSTLVLPLYRHADRGQVAGILEVIQTSEDMVFSELVEILSQVLEECSLYTCDQAQRDSMRSSQPAMIDASIGTSKGVNSTHFSASQTSSHGSPKSILAISHGRDSASPEGADETNGQLPRAYHFEAGDNSIRGRNAQQQQQQLSSVGGQHDHEAVRGSNAAAAALGLLQAPQGMVTRHSAVQNKQTDGFHTRDSSLTGFSLPEDSKISSCYDDEEIGSEDGDGWEDDMEDSAEGAGSGDINGRLANRRRGKGTGNPGKPGKKLRLADLQSQFGVGLKEAANKLGICPTTLKRACRRHGIQRWPRRQLARLTRAIDQIRTSGDPAPPLEGMADRPLRSSSRGRAASEGGALGHSPQSAPTSSAEQALSEPGPDTRWSALDQLIPTFSNPLDEASVHGPSKAYGGLSAPTPPTALEGSLSPGLIHPQGTQHETALEVNPTLIHSQPAEASAVDLSLHMGLSSIAAADPWPASSKDDPWTRAHAHKLGFASVTAEHGSSVHLGGGSLSEHMIGAEDETVHGGSQSFHDAMSLQPSGHHCDPGCANAAFDQGGLNIPGVSSESADRHRMAASHSPQMGNGLLAESLETSIPMFGHSWMPHSMPNMMTTPTVLRHTLGLQHPLALSGLGHSQSMAHMSSDLLSQTLQTQRGNHLSTIPPHLLQHDPTMPKELSAQLQCRSPSPFELTSREGMSHFGEQGAVLSHFGGDGVGHDMGLMDTDMLDMLLKPE